MKDYIQKTLQFARKYPLSCCCIVLVWLLSLMPFPDMPEMEDVPFADKWTHFLMYGGTCSVIWTEYLRRHQALDVEELYFWAWLAPIVMSGVLELLQEYCTASRSGEWLDLAANATGVTLGAVYGLLLSLFLRRARSHPSHE